MQSFDLTVIGGGMVGLSLAAALSKTPISIAIIENTPATKLSSNEIPTRVSAISYASKAILEKVNAWQHIAPTRITPYHSMQVWDKDSFGKISFDLSDLPDSAIDALGYIIENDQIQNALLQQVQSQENVTFHLPDSLKQMAVGEGEAWLTLESGKQLISKLVVGADGAHSALRRMNDIPLVHWDYNHHALVATIKTELPHGSCTRQIFTPEGPLAFLPLFDEHLCSIIWSVSPEKAVQLQSLSHGEFNKQLSREFDSQLGFCELQNETASFPLKMRYARDFAQHRIALIGYAAHTIHPLAGQGVNLGLLDAISLAETIISNIEQEKDIGAYTNLRHFERWRKTEATQMLASMELLKRTFHGNNPLQKLLRDVALVLADNVSPLKTQFIKQAMGLNGELPVMISAPAKN
ncbi:MAG TPA: FAD-dependent 2-octaprenylphenol hydroxylase [Psychromonas hadalis]|nr:FAD-dependent 2-octaprenylphenol hydroxylase [Psychromonas hadalis]